MENKLKNLIQNCNELISQKGYLELGHINDVRIEAEKIADNEDEISNLVLDCEDYLQDNYNCIDDALSGYVYSKELNFKDIEEFYNYFDITEEEIQEKYKF